MRFCNLVTLSNSLLLCTSPKSAIEPLLHTESRGSGHVTLLEFLPTTSKPMCVFTHLPPMSEAEDSSLLWLVPLSPAITPRLRLLSFIPSPRLHQSISSACQHAQVSPLLIYYKAFLVPMSFTFCTKKWICIYLLYRLPVTHSLLILLISDIVNTESTLLQDSLHDSSLSEGFLASVPPLPLGTNPPQGLVIGLMSFTPFNPKEISSSLVTSATTVLPVINLHMWFKHEALISIGIFCRQESNTTPHRLLSTPALPPLVKTAGLCSASEAWTPAGLKLLPFLQPPQTLIPSSCQFS